MARKQESVEREQENVDREPERIKRIPKDQPILKDYEYDEFYEFEFRVFNTEKDISRTMKSIEKEEMVESYTSRNGNPKEIFYMDSCEINR